MGISGDDGGSFLTNIFDALLPRPLSELKDENQLAIILEGLQADAIHATRKQTYEGGVRFEPCWLDFWAELSPLGLLLDVLFDLPTGVTDDEAAAREDAALAAAYEDDGLDLWSDTGGASGATVGGATTAVVMVCLSLEWLWWSSS